MPDPYDDWMGGSLKEAPTLPPPTFSGSDDPFGQWMRGEQNPPRRPREQWQPDAARGGPPAGPAQRPPMPGDEAPFNRGIGSSISAGAPPPAPPAPPPLPPDVVEEQRRKVGEAVGKVRHSGPVGVFLERGLPFGSSLSDLVLDRMYSNAKDNLAWGRATDRDYEAIATYQAREEDAAAHPWARGLAGITNAVGEMMFAAGKAGQLFKGAEAGAPKLLSKAGLIGAAKAAPAAAGRAFVQQAVLPETYAGWANRNVAEGRDAYDLSTLPANAAMNTAQFAVVGSMGKVARIGGTGALPTLARGATQAVTGMAEQAAVDAAAGKLSEYLPDALKLRNGYGTLHDLVNHKEGAAREATLQAIAFAAFAALHEVGGRQAAGRNAALAEVERYNATLEALSKRGGSLPASARELNAVQSDFREQLAQNPGLGRADVLARYSGLAEGPVRDYARGLAAILPETAKPAAAPEAPQNAPEAAPSPVAPEAAVGSPETPIPAPGQEPAQAPAEPEAQTARQQSDQLEKAHLGALQEVQDARRSETAAKNLASVGYPNQTELRAARSRRLVAERNLGQIEREWETQRTQAATEEAAGARAGAPEQDAAQQEQGPRTIDVHDWYPTDPKDNVPVASPERTRALVEELRQHQDQGGTILLSNRDKPTPFPVRVVGDKLVDQKGQQWGVLAQAMSEGKLELAPPAGQVGKATFPVNAAVEGSGVPGYGLKEVPARETPTKPSKTEARLHDVIEKTLDRDDIATLKEVWKHLRRTGRAVSYQEVQTALDQMTEQGRLSRTQFHPNDDPVYATQQLDKAIRGIPAERLEAEIAKAKKELDDAKERDIRAAAQRGAGDAASLQRGLDGDLQKGLAAAQTPAASEGTRGPAPRVGESPPAPARGRAAGGDVVRPEGWEAWKPLQKATWTRTKDPYMKQVLQNRFNGVKTLFDEVMDQTRGKGLNPETLGDRGKQGLKLLQENGLPTKKLFGKNGGKADALAEQLLRSGSLGQLPPDMNPVDHLLDLLLKNHVVDMGLGADRAFLAQEEAYYRELADAQAEHTPAEIAEAVRAGEKHGEIAGSTEAVGKALGDLVERPAHEGDESERPESGPGATASEVEPGVFFSGGPGGGPGRPGAGTAGSAGGAGGAGGRSRVGPYEIAATVRQLFNLPVYVESRLQADADALYRVKPEAAEVNKMAAGNAPVVIHELAHHLRKQLALNLDPAALPRDVREGFRQFDYEPGRVNARVGMQEGFAEWLRMRETGQLQNLSPEQQAAADYAEQMLAGRPAVMEKLNRVRGLFQQFGSQSPGEQFGGFLSRTGKPARPEVTPGESAASYLQKTRQAAADNLLDDAMPAKRAERAATSRGEAFAPGQKLSEVIATTRLRNVPDAHEMEQGGVFAYGPDGKRAGLSQPLKEAVKGLSAEEAAPGGDLDRLMHSLRILHDVSTDAVDRSPEQVEGARGMIRDLLQSDPERFRRLEGAAKNVTDLFNATLDALALSGRITRERADYLKAQHPFYVSEQRITEPDFRSVAPFGGRRKGEEPRTATFLQRRTGSGEQMMNWLDALRDRYRFTASVLNDQAKFRALLDLSQREGVGHWLDPGEPGKGPEGEPAGWPRDGSKPSITGYVAGEPVRVRVNDKPFYELVTGTQGEGDRVYGLFRSIGDFAQMIKIPQVVRAGATVMSPLWHVKNFIRDPILYTQRTVADKGTIGNLADLFQWYGKSINFYGRALLGGGADAVPVKQATDNYFKLMERMTGREMEWGAVSGERTMTSRVMDGWPGFFQRVSDLVTSGEKGTRVLEMKNVLDKLGWTQERITDELARDPSQRNPLPFAVQVAALDVASQITHNVHTMGAQVRQLNRSWPFLGAHIAGVYKDLQTYATQPKKVLGSLMILALAKGAEYLANHDDPEWNELADHNRFGFSFKTPLGWMNFPAPRGLTGIVTGMMDYAIRQSSKNNPRFPELMGQALEEVGPHGGPEPWMTGVRVATNRNWMSRPIIPDREANRMGMADRFTDPRMLAYQASQYTGGMLDPRRLSVNPFAMDQHPHQTVYDLKDALNKSELAHDKANDMARRQGLKGVLVPPDLARMRRADGFIRKLENEFHLDRTTEQRKGEIRRLQIDFARRGLGASK